MRIWTDVEQGSEKWFDLKSGRITGTEFQVMMSGKTTKGYNTLLRKTVFESLYGVSLENDYTSEWMERGSLMEMDARNWYEGEILSVVEEVGFVEIDDWFGFSPDGMIGNDGIVEIKCPKWSTHMDYMERDLKSLPPSPYKYQVIGPMAFINELEWVDFVSYHDILPPMRRRYYRTDVADEIDQFLERVKEVREELVMKYQSYQTNLMFK